MGNVIVLAVLVVLAFGCEAWLRKLSSRDNLRRLARRRF
jgi:hypothetical protein